MAATVSQVATGLAARLGTISGLRTYTYQPEQLNPPVAFPVLNSVRYHNTFQGGDVLMDWTVNVVVGRYLDRTAHAALDGYLSYSGASSIRTALEGDLTLGGVVQTLVVPSAIDITSLSDADAQFLQIQVSVLVHA
jgi:hypothetical protein